MKPELTSIALSDEETSLILKWIDELEGPCSESYAAELVTRLAEALESCMGIDKEILNESLHCSFVDAHMPRSKWPIAMISVNGQRSS
jgi:hypothetical protein